VPVVLVLVNGRPFSMVWEVQNLSAILEAGSRRGGRCRHCKGRSLARTIPPGACHHLPALAGQVPVFYAQRPAGGESHWKGAYVDESYLPLTAFGHGLTTPALPSAT
jgi:beta-glucosidase